MNQACPADTINIRISCDIVLYHVILSKLYHMRTSISDVDLYFQILKIGRTVQLKQSRTAHF
jgi:hypothetical protein